MRTSKDGPVGLKVRSVRVMVAGDKRGQGITLLSHRPKRLAGTRVDLVLNRPVRQRGCPLGMVDQGQEDGFVLKPGEGFSVRNQLSSHIVSPSSLIVHRQLSTDFLQRIWSALPGLLRTDPEVMLANIQETSVCEATLLKTSTDAARTAQVGDAA